MFRSVAYMPPRRPVQTCLRPKFRPSTRCC